MFNMEEFEERLSGDIRFIVLDVNDSKFPKKDGSGFHETIDLSLNVTELHGNSTTDIKVRIFKNRTQQSQFYKFADSVNKVYSGIEGLENLIGATGQGKLYYNRNNFPAIDNWVFYQPPQNTAEVLSSYMDEEDWSNGMGDTLDATHTYNYNDDENIWGDGKHV